MSTDIQTACYTVLESGLRVYTKIPTGKHIYPLEYSSKEKFDSFRRIPSYDSQEYLALDSRLYLSDLLSTGNFLNIILKDGEVKYNCCMEVEKVLRTKEDIDAVSKIIYARAFVRSPDLIMNVGYENILLVQLRRVSFRHEVLLPATPQNPMETETVAPPCKKARESVVAPAKKK